jgi:hypothetical protein
MNTNELLSEQNLFLEKCNKFYEFLRQKKVDSFDLSSIKEFDKEIKFDDASIIFWIGVGKGFWKLSNDYKIYLNSTE